MMSPDTYKKELRRLINLIKDGISSNSSNLHNTDSLKKISEKTLNYLESIEPFIDDLDIFEAEIVSGAIRGIINELNLDTSSIT